jgi:hypothetical protein
MKSFRSLVAVALTSSLLLPAVAAKAAELAHIKVDTTAVGDVVVSYEPRLAKVINRTFMIPDAEIKLVELLRTRLDDSSGWYRVVYDEGPSVDPEFVIYFESEGKEREVLREFGLSLTIPGDGFVYLSGHTNNHFDTVKKFAVKPDGASEVRQPFYFVGITTTVLEPVDLFDSPEKTNVVTTAAKGEAVTVVLNQDDFYLVRAANGLVGWVKLKEDGTATQFRDINYAGD